MITDIIIISGSRPNIIQNPANIYLFKVSNRNSRKRYEICSKLTIKTPELQHIFTPFSSVSIVELEQVNITWEACLGPCQTSMVELFRESN